MKDVGNNEEIMFQADGHAKRLGCTVHTINKQSKLWHFIRQKSVALQLHSLCMKIKKSFFFFLCVQLKLS